MMKIFKDKKGEGMFLFYMMLIVIAGMFLALHFDTTMLILQRGKLYAIADEAANKAAWEVYKWDKQGIESGGKPNVSADMVLAASIAQKVFSDSGYTLQNAKAHLDGAYLVIEGDINSVYSQPILPAGTSNVRFHVEGRANLKKIK